jgi:DNA-binding CsgD family transcriptional regulator
MPRNYPPSPLGVRRPHKVGHKRTFLAHKGDPSAYSDAVLLKERLDTAVQVRRTLASGSSLVLAGPRGSGRTSVVEEAARLVGGRAYVVRGSEGRSGIPLAACSELVSSFGDVDAEPLRLYATLPKVLLSAEVVVLVDDADHLDLASAALLSQSARAGVPMAFATSSPSLLPPSFRDARERSGWPTYELEPLADDQVLALAAAQLGDELSPQSAALLLSHARGNPRIALELVRSATGMSSTTAGIDLGTLILTPVIRDLVDLSRVSDDQLHLLRLLCLAGPLPLDVLDLAGVEELERQGLVDCTRHEQQEIVSLVDPLLDDVVTETLTPLARRRLAGELADALEPLPGWTGVATLAAVRAGRGPDPRRLELGARRALSAGQPTEAMELLRACLADDGRDQSLEPRLAVLLGAALSAQGALTEAREVLEKGLADAGTDLERRDLGQQLGLLHAVRASDPATAVSTVEAIASGINDPECRAVLLTDLAKWRMMAGHPATDVTLALPGVGASLDAAAAVNGALIAAMIEVLGGSLPEARRHVELGRRGLLETDAALTFAPHLLDLSSFLAEVFDGRVVAAEEFATLRRNAAARAADESLGMWEFATAEVALHVGRYALGVELASRARRHLAWRDFTGLRPTAVALDAALMARTGRPSTALDLLSEVTDEHRADIKVELHVARVRAEAALVSGDRAGAAEVLAVAARRAVEEAHLHLAVLALDEAFMVDPSAERAAELTSVAPPTGLAALLVARVEAVRSGKAQTIIEASRSLMAAGMPGRAGWSAAKAASLTRESGSEAASRSYRHQATVLASEHGASLWPDDADAVVLTPRELQIARLAAARVRSREIAEQLDLSARTVDNHLARIFRKLAISGRGDLAAALAVAEVGESVEISSS